MKKAVVLSKHLMFPLFMVLLSFIASAQDKSVDVNISSDKGGGGFMSSPIVWVIGIAVFILLLVALLRRK